MRALFRACERANVRYLLIGGQASVLYGAAYFTQDCDLWVEPSPRNVRALLSALESLKAKVHKLTPPLTSAHLARGHGFHFRVPMRGSTDLYLDVMGRPPRVAAFGAAARRAVAMDTSWGRLPVVAIEDLVELKKTNRPGDYDVITRLALLRLSRERVPSARTLGWALPHVFNVEDLWTLIQNFGAALRHPQLTAAARILLRAQIRGRAPRAAEMSRAALMLAQVAHRLQDLGRAYWLPRIDELRRLRAAGQLLPEGLPVNRLLAP